MKSVTITVLLVGLISAVFAQTTDWSTFDLNDSRMFYQGQLTVRFKSAVDIDRVGRLLEPVLAVEKDRIEPLNAVRLEVPDAVDIYHALEYFTSLPDVLYAEPVTVQRVFWTPNDPHFGLQWNMDADHLNMEAAWDIEQGSSGVVVAIIDTGIAFEDYEIPAYEAVEVSSDDGRYHPSPDFTPDQFVPGYDFVHDDAHPNDQYGHGTHVAGTVAQATDNGTGVAGMAPGVKLMPVQVLDYTGSGSDFDIADGITWAADNGAHVINMSLGGFPGVPSEVEHDAIKYATEKDVLCVAAAGNLFIPILSYPAGFEECIAVAAYDYNDQRSVYSQYGDGLDISAPGGDTSVDEDNDGNPDGIVQSTYAVPGDGEEGAKVDEFAYSFFQGTSMATPHVAGLAALLVSDGITGVDNLKSVIYTTARDLGPAGYDTEAGWGMIDPVAALNFEPSAVAEQESDLVVGIDAFPNPFFSSTTVSFSLANPSPVNISAWSVDGRRVASLVDEFKKQGTHSITWNGTDDQGNQLPQGVYYVVIKTASASFTEKLLIVR